MESMQPMIGSVVVDPESAGVPGLIVELPPKTIDEYVVRSTGASGGVVSVADRNPGYPKTDPVAIVVFDPILRRSFADWREEPRKVISSYRSGSFASAAVALPASRLEPAP